MHTAPNGKSYIGFTKNLYRRNILHRHSSSKCLAFAAAIKKYGWDGFTHQILAENLSFEEAKDREAYFIEKYNTMAPNGYNLDSGGRYPIQSPEIIAKRSLSLTGKKLSEETKNKISSAKKGVKQSPEHVENRRKSMLGRAVSEETRRKISEANRNPSDETRRKKSESAKNRKYTSEEIEKRIAHFRGKKQTPELIAKRADAIRKAWARKKEAAQRDLYFEP